MPRPDDATRELLMGFESLGGFRHGCEFGLVQREAGIEPLGLLRWAEMYPEELAHALYNRFEGVGSAEQTALYIDHVGKYRTRDKLFGMRCQTFVFASSTPEDKMLSSARTRLLFLKNKMLNDLEEGKKIFVYKLSNRRIHNDEFSDLYRAIRGYGDTVLLYVRLADDEHPFPTVEWQAPGLMVGYIDKFTQQGGGVDVPVPFDSWVTLCRAADIVRRSNPIGAFAIQSSVQRRTTRNVWTWALRTAGETGQTFRGSLLAHIAHEGDVLNEAALIGGKRDAGRAIQGFAITVPLPASEIEYRALFPDGTWTDWRPGGAFVGSRGRSLSLRGFAVRLLGQAAADFECRYGAVFLGEPEMIEAAGGQECRSASGADLEAMVVLLRRRTPETARAAGPSLEQPATLRAVG